MVSNNYCIAQMPCYYCIFWKNKTNNVQEKPANVVVLL